MIVWWRNADDDEAQFLTLVARESGASSGLCDEQPGGRSCIRVITTDGVVSGFYRLAWNRPCGHAELDHLYVLAHRRGAGLGRTLLHDLHRTAAQLGLPGVRIVAHPPSERFFTCSGAQRVATLPRSTTVAWARPVLHLDVARALPTVIAAAEAADRTRAAV